MVLCEPHGSARHAVALLVAVTTIFLLARILAPERTSYALRLFATSGAAGSPTPSPVSFPLRFVTWSVTWRLKHPSWTHIFWTDADNLELIQRFYPESLATYLGLPAEIYRANMVRNAYLHRFGGVYADLDLESLRLLDNLLDRPETVYDGIVTAFVASMEVTTDHMKEDIPNAWMASSAPGHPLWLDILRAVEDR